MTSDVALAHPDFAGLHFTGSTTVFKGLWRKTAEHIDSYRTYPRLVGETGGKDFVVAHPSADPDALVVALAGGRSSTRARSARPRHGRMCRARCGHACGTGSRISSARSPWATSPTSPTSWARSSTSVHGAG